MGPGRPCIWETVVASRLAPMHPAGFYNVLRSGDVTGHRIENPTHHTSSQRSSKRERESSLLFTTSWEIFKSCHFQGGADTAIGIFVMKIKMKMLTIIITGNMTQAATWRGYIAFLDLHPRFCAGLCKTCGNMSSFRGRPCNS